MLSLTDTDLKKIIKRRDSRYDGRFYFGVKTTRVYCRPVCPAKPKPENIRIFKSTSEAEKNGYRPCKRCHPDLAPTSKLLDGTLSTVSRALRIINDSTDDDLNINQLADSLGVSDRHLRRLFDEHLGASPIEVMITQRLHLAKQLVQATKLPIIDIVFASGFQSVRRFNEAFKARFHSAPLHFRKNNSIKKNDGLILKVPIRLPYDWPYITSYLRKHECYGLESVTEDNKYQRFVPNNIGFGVVTVSHNSTQDYLSVNLVDVPANQIRNILARIKNLFDTEANPKDLPSNDQLKPKGIRSPGSFDPFEVAVSIVLSQLVSTKHAKTNLKTLVQKFGRLIARINSQEIYEFPSPQVLKNSSVEVIGITTIKAQAIRQLSRGFDQGEIKFNSHSDFSEAYKDLISIKGIGHWTATMIGMRCLGDPDAFPKGDLIIQRAVEEKLVNQANWSSSRAYLTHVLWRDYGKQLSKSEKRK